MNFVRRYDTLTAQCRACPWLSCCQGGCLKDRFALSADGEAGQYYLCDGLRQFFAHADRPLHRVMGLARERKRPSEIREIIREELPTNEALLEMMKIAGAPVDPAEVHVSPEFMADAMRYHPYMRYRLLITRLLPMMGIDPMDYLD